MEQYYITALISALRNGVAIEDALPRLKASLAKRQHEKLYAPVLAGSLRVLMSDEKQSGGVVTVANPSDVDSAAVQSALEELGISGAPTVVVDDTIIGGSIVSYRHRRIDASYKTALTTLYRAITK
jgi:F0F1-type ATP synthase delta subunit